jgi:hypothetical protein
MAKMNKYISSYYLKTNIFYPSTDFFPLQKGFLYVLSTVQMIYKYAG